MQQTLLDAAARAVRVMVEDSIKQTPQEGMVVIADADSVLSRTLCAAYTEAYPWAEVWAWDPELFPAEEVRRRFQKLAKGTLVVLVQSTSFRLDAFRIRLELFARGLRTIEHVHLGRMTEPDEQLRYLEGCSYGASHFTTQANAISEVVKKAQQLALVSRGGEKLVWDTLLEDPKQNTGNYAGMVNVGGTFPVGEVFTEGRDLARVNGEVRIFAMANSAFEVKFFEPFRVRVERGEVVLQGDEPEMFREVIELIMKQERPMVRELGFGLNPAFGKDRFVTDVTAFERQRGVHLSLGEKHPVYPKEGMHKRNEARYHVDVFVDVERVVTDLGTLYENGEFVV